MILRGIGTPVQGGDAANKDYVDGKVGINDWVVIANSNGVIAKSAVSTYADAFYSIMPVYIGRNTAYFTIDIMNSSNRSISVSIADIVSSPIKDISLLVADLASPYVFVDNDRLRVDTDAARRLNINGTMIGHGMVTVQF